MDPSITKVRDRTQGPEDSDFGIPHALFIEDIPEYLARFSTDTETTIGKLQVMN
jgi:hypothetical protein